jgi:hypothetical protein
MFKKFFILLALASVMLTACSLGVEVPATQTVPTLVADALPPEVAVEIQNRISEALGVAVDRIQIETVEQQQWPNGCLGLPEPDEVCTEAITPGWLVVFSVDGTEYRYRADETGTNIRQEP